MDRTIIYPGAIPLETDLLNTNRNTFTALGSLAQDLFGTSTVFSGLNCVPTALASMSVSIAPGRVYALQNRDNTAYSSLPADTAHQLMKQGILLDAQTFSCPAPQTSGFSVNYLISANFVEQDVSPIVLPYYNATNPAQAFSGPPANGNSSGAAQNTVRQNTVQLTLTPGVAAATGNQMTPSAPAGATPLWVITVAYGQTSITAANIAAAPNSPFAPTGGYFAAVGERYSGIQNVAGNSILTTAALGALVNVTATGTTQTLPPAANCPNGTSITIVYMQSSGSVSVVHNGNDILVFGQGNSTNSLTLNPGEEVQFVSNGVNSWVSAGQTLSTGVTAAQFDNSSKLATTSFVQQALGAVSGENQYNSSQILTAANDANKLIVIGSTGGNITLPARSTVVPGTKLYFMSQGGTSTLFTQGSDALWLDTTTVPNLPFGLGDYFEVTAASNSNVWMVTSGTPLLGKCSGFASSQLGIGYQKLPSGMIIQWGSGATNSSGTFTTSLPITFPNGWFTGYSSCQQAGSFTTTVSNLVTTTISVIGYSSSNGVPAVGLYVTWLALGR